MAAAGGWQIVEERGSAASLHSGSADALNWLGSRRPGSARPGSGRLVRVLTADAAALVLGSNQPASSADGDALARAGVDLVRRRSGGGAVLVGPGLVLWVDFVVAADDPLWSDDVGRAAWWVGDLWAAALARSGSKYSEYSEHAVWRGPMKRTPASSLVCFAGVGPGEVVDGAGRKVVGVSQRRTPRAALFQTAVMLSWTPGRYASFLGIPESDIDGVVAEAGSGAGPVLLQDLLGLLATLT